MNAKQLLGNNVKKCRETRKMSQEDLAEKSGLHRTYISGIERGVRNPTITVVLQLAEALDVAPSILLEKAKEE
jgi:transcriptional regulator with XRE-family HTH domain